MRSRFLILLLPLLLLSGCAANETTTNGKPRLVATYSVLGDLVRNVAGDRVELTTLVGGDGDTHAFEPAPQDAVALVRADVIVENGLGFEGWLDDLYTSSASKARRVVVSDGLDLIGGGCPCCSKKSKKAGCSLAEENDPHVWHDVQNAIHMVHRIRDELTSIDPANAAEYQSNADAYLRQLRDLDDWVAEQVATLPAARRKLVTNHAVFGYFSKRYGFEVVGTALASFSTEASDPSASAFATLAEAVKANDIATVFPENVHNPKLMQRLAQEAGVKLGPPLYTDALGKTGSEADTYIKMMRTNVTAIVSNLKR